jgi:hypothetical protein
MLSLKYPIQWDKLYVIHYQQQHVLFLSPTIAEIFAVLKKTLAESFFNWSERTLTKVCNNVYDISPAEEKNWSNKDTHSLDFNGVIAFAPVRYISDLYRLSSMFFRTN